MRDRVRLWRTGDNKPVLVTGCYDCIINPLPLPTGYCAYIHTGHNQLVEILECATLRELWYAAYATMRAYS